MTNPKTYSGQRYSVCECHDIIPSVRLPRSKVWTPGSLKNTGIAHRHSWSSKLLRIDCRQLETGTTHTKASPKPFDDAFFNTSVPPSSTQHGILVLNQTRVLSLHKHLFGVLSAEECNFFCEFGQTGMRVSEGARKLSGQSSISSERRCEGTYCICLA